MLRSESLLLSPRIAVLMLKIERGGRADIKPGAFKRGDPTERDPTNVMIVINVPAAIYN